MIQKSAIVIGAGIVGLAISRALAIRGFHVTVIERNHKAVGASFRNFGMVLPIAQPDGILFDRAMSSRNIWKEVCDSAKIWYDEVGSLQLGYAKDEWNVLSELKDVYNHRGYELLDRKKTLEKSPAVVAENLYGSLFSKNEIIVDPRMAIFQMPKWLNEKYNVNFIWGKAVSRISHPSVYCGNESFQADEIFVCTGSDFETLYPEAFDEMNITKCKLQMMRLITQPNNWRIGPMLCGGLSLINYYSFTKAPSLDLLKKRLHEEYPEYIKWGIHVMVSQNQAGELIVGDSHEYGSTHDPFDKNLINDLILDYLKRMALFQNSHISETWNGVYAKMTNGETEVVINPESGVTIVNGLGGAGMTLSFGLAEEIISKK